MSKLYDALQDQLKTEHKKEAEVGKLLDPYIQKNNFLNTFIALHNESGNIR